MLKIHFNMGWQNSYNVAINCPTIYFNQGQRSDSNKARASQDTSAQTLPMAQKTECIHH